MSKTYCRACGAEIIWIKTLNGKSMPCDATPIYYRLNSESKEKIVTSKGVVVSADRVSDPGVAYGTGFVPHWSTCPDADKFRKR